MVGKVWRTGVDKENGANCRISRLILATPGLVDMIWKQKADEGRMNIFAVLWHKIYLRG